MADLSFEDGLPDNAGRSSRHSYLLTAFTLLIGWAAVSQSALWPFAASRGGWLTFLFISALLLGAVLDRLANTQGRSSRHSYLLTAFTLGACWTAVLLSWLWPLGESRGGGLSYLLFISAMLLGGVVVEFAWRKISRSLDRRFRLAGLGFGRGRTADTNDVGEPDAGFR